MKDRRIHWDNIDIDYDWCMKHHANTGVDVKPRKVPPQLAPFMKFARSQWKSKFAVLEYVCVRVVDKNNFSEEFPDYGEGFPDLHDNKLMSVCVCVKMPEAGGDWEIDTPEGKLYYPCGLGDGLIIRGDEQHWVTRVKGDKIRITIAAHFKGVWEEWNTDS